MKFKEFLERHPKFKNPYFWLSIVALIFSASGVDFEGLTSWRLLGEALVSIGSNPVSIVAIITSFLGIYNDNSTRGLDGINKKANEDK